MKNWFILITVALLGMETYAAVAYGVPVPDGPFRQTCTRCSVNGRNNTLYCTCNTANRRPNNTSLRLPCTQPIHNCNGALRCGPC